ncbi:hypothetical protein D3260_03790 [Salinisphaera sp. Q1T1-3]|nr:hypothetical protein D3260_03790 [Salinisphaera sp. Q1T1-3]
MSHTHLSARERCNILLMSQFGLNQAEVARHLGRHRSTISRELKRNQSPYNRHYHDFYAQHAAERRRRAARHRRRWDHPPLVDFVMAKLALFWPPEAIAGRLIARFPNTPAMRISAQQIYAWIAADAVTGGCCISASDAGIKDAGVVHHEPAIAPDVIRGLISINGPTLSTGGVASATGRATR